MNFALNCSPQAAALIQSGRIQVDLLKCPAWPELISAALDIGPSYVHFPLNVGDGIGNAIHSEKGQPADWAWIEQILQQTGTRYVNLHLHPPRSANVLPDGGYGPAATAETTERLIRDVEAMVKHFGAERVIVENGYNLDRHPLRPAYFAEVISRVVETTGCGFLFDLSHARMAASILDVSVKTYVAGLPLHATRELHITGIQFAGDHWIERMKQEGVAPSMIENISGRLMDHLPLVGDDWEAMRWAAESIREGIWNRPDIIALECGGYGPFWQATLDETALAEQVPRLYAMFAS